ncbi:methenyltetrahydromethanopterin cyclohydrolase [archaeon]|nr:methenyltetrahydromethanopterin cyclohydrolase [archaeon]
MNLNENAVNIAKELIERKSELNIEHFELENGTKIIDCGVNAPGSLEAGRLFALACMGGLAEIEIKDRGLGLKKVIVKTEHPAISCLASQKAGWCIDAEGYFALGSGPARILAKKPKETIEKVGYVEEADASLIALESGKFPPAQICDMIARECGIRPENLYVLIARTASLAATVQISARMVETCLFKMDHLGYDTNTIKSASGTAPIAPLIGDDNLMMGLTNDMVIYGSSVSLEADADFDVDKIPSSSSPDYGRPFAQIFKDAGYNFYKIDEGIFAPALVSIENTQTNEIKKAGEINNDIIGRVTKK